jgi:hypothetical protein
MDEQREALNELRVRIENCRSRTDEYGRGLLAGYQAALDLFEGDCVCRTTSCQHGAHLHHNGVCEVCNKGICWC